MPGIKSATQSIARRPSSFFAATVLHAGVFSSNGYIIIQSTTATHPRSVNTAHRRSSASLKWEKNGQDKLRWGCRLRKLSRSLSRTVNHDSETVIYGCDSDEDECVSDVDEWDSSDECDSDKYDSDEYDSDEYDSDEYNSQEHNSDDECGSKPGECEGDRDEPEVDIDDCYLQPPPNKLNGLSSAHPGLPMNGAGRFSATSGPVGVQHRKERRERRRLYVDVNPMNRIADVVMWLNYVPIVPTLKLFFGGGIDNLHQCDQHSTVDAVGALERSAGTIGATSNNQMDSYSVGGAADKLRRKRLNTCKTPARQNNEVLLTDGVIKSISELTGRLDCVEKTLQLDPYPFFGTPDVAALSMHWIRGKVRHILRESLTDHPPVHQPQNRDLRTLPLQTELFLATLRVG
ncbi:hypothetical protein B0H13DRAFT_1911254 [Mycena leptocephala]|nr:hypothetical protein B0H13DRAFT_1911254 [Mycena leptocephala]